MTNANHALADGWGQTSEEILTKNFPLHKACRDGDVETLSILLVEAQHGIYVEDSFYGWTPAHWSSYFGKLNCLMKLLEMGMNCDIATMRLNQTPSHIAAFARNLHCLKWLIHCGASKDRQDYLGETPAHKGARNGSIECLSLLANHGARLYIRNNNNLTPAQLSAECGYVDCSKYLESVASRQEQSEFKGVYENQNVVSSLSSHSMSSPSCHDVTLNTASPCSSNFGISAAPQVPSPISEERSESPMHSMNELNQVEFEMDEEIDSHVENFSFQLCSKHNLFNCDITINKDVSFNKLAVAGKKRCREDTEESDYKRIRRDESVYPWLMDTELGGDIEFTDVQCDKSNPNQINTWHTELDLDDSDAMSPVQVKQEADDSCKSNGNNHCVYNNILSLSTEPLKLDKPVLPFYANNKNRCRYYIFM